MAGGERPALLLQANPCVPRASTGTPHVHMWGSHRIGAKTQTHSHPDERRRPSASRPMISAALEARHPARGSETGAESKLSPGSVHR